MIDRKTILEVLGRFQEYFGKGLKPEIQALYVEHLSQMPEDKFKAASVRLLSEFHPTNTVPFPLIRDFLEMAGMDEKTTAVNIVSFVRSRMEAVGQYDSVDLGDTYLHSVIQRYGGWAEMVNNNTDEWWSLHERNFIQAYESAKRAGLEGPKHLIGTHEAQNRITGFTPEKLAELGINPRVGGYLDGPKAKEKQVEFDAPQKKIGDMTLREKLRALPAT